MPAIALCADDYAQHEGIDDAVCKLLAAHRISAVSCMSTAPRWKAYAAPRLREQLMGDPCADTGLHLNLTEFFGRQASLPRLIARAYTRTLDKAALKADMARQFDAFEAGMRRQPHFVDGHQHVHQFPQVRSVLIEMLEQRYTRYRPWVRSTVPLAGLDGIKPAVLKWLGGAAMTRRLHKRGFRCNAGFGGVYGFDTDNYAGQFQQWINLAGEASLLMCHPASSESPNDPISAQRLVEFAFLRSDACGAMLAARNIRIVRMSSLLPPT
ncbi:MAG: ChbG/HpnK family deacetylase [Pseudomonadota bacterium]